jgi:uncharacterized protein (DUF779 family)
MIQRVIATEAALALVRRLQQEHGTLLFYQSHGCCDGSTPMLFVQGEMGLGADDVQLGEVAGVPFHASRMQLDYLAGSQLTLEDADGVHFVTRSRLWTDEEWLVLKAQDAQKAQDDKARAGARS